MKPTVLLDYEFVVSANAYAVRALLKLEGRVPDGEARQPLNLALVLDRSGSMSGQKLAAAREAAALLVRRLDPRDLVSVVAFDDQVTPVAEPASGAEQARLARTIQQIVPGGSTNLSGGWLLGREFVARNLGPTGTHRVVLLTDGQANVGIIDPEALAGLCRAAREHGITTTTIGFGSDYEEGLLRDMADSGGGNTYYIETPDQAPGIFEEEIEGLLSLSAHNIRVEVRPGPAVLLATVHHSYPSQATAAGVELFIGDLYAREPRTLLVEFTVPATVATGGGPIAECVVTADVLTSDGGVERQEVRLPIHDRLGAEGRSEPEVRREVLLLGAARAREAALRAQEEGDYDEGQRYLREARQAFQAEGTPPMDALLREEVADLEAMESRLTPERYTTSDTKYLFQRAYNSTRGRGASSRRISRTGAGRVDYRQGDASDPTGAEPRIIAFVGNDQGAWGKGFVMALSARWPAAREAYLRWQAGQLPDAPPFALGEVLLTEVEPGVWVANLLAQQGLRPTGGRPPVQYDALERALRTLAAEARARGAAVQMPRIGTGLAGGSWRRIEPMIEECLVDAGVAVTIYDLPLPSPPTS